MKYGILAICFAFLLNACEQKDKNEALRLSSPGGKNEIVFELIEGKPFFSVNHGNRKVINASSLGFVFKGQDSLANDLELIGTETATFDETWEQVWGEKKYIKNNFNSVKIHLREKKDGKRKISIVFRAYDDGIAFRYVYPKQSHENLVIMDELTRFNVSEDGDAWWIRAYQDNRYEYLTSKTPLSAIDTVHTPLTVQTSSGLVLCFHEASLKDYTSMTLERTGGTELKSNLVPWSDGDRVKTKGSFITPWRTLQIADTPKELLTSYLILNLNEPNKIEDTTWIKPFKYIGIWWGMHIGKYTFWESPKQGATTANAFKYIDYCQDLGIDHLLIEGWNKGWTPAWYENAMHQFSFTEEADNFDLKKVTDYAKEHGVQIIGYHETGSNIINYLNQIDRGMKRYHELGIKDVKIGQVGSRLNMKEWHYGQFGVNYYRFVLEKALEYKLTVNFHEPIKDTGERRTYPNMMSREGARGQEYNAWSEGNPPGHTAILPFTRMMSGPMDFTPGIFDVEITQGFEGRDVHTTLAKQLALYVVLYSPIQMLADLPENYINQPAFEFLKDVPVDWEDTKILNAEIGEYITTARKDKYSDDWYLGSLTNEKDRHIQVPLTFLDSESRYKAQVYADADGISWKERASEIEISHFEVSSKDTLRLRLAKGGGAAVRLMKLDVKTN